LIDTALQDRTALAIGLLAFVLGVLPTCTFAEGISIQGRVADPQGNAIPHAVVSLISTEHKNAQLTRTAEEGQFSFSA
jgi:hypothetical protein